MIVIAIIALLMGILFPALNTARQSARSTQSLSNVRQIGAVGIPTYVGDHGEYPWHSSTLSASHRPDGETAPRWADYIYSYVPSTKVFVSPMIDLSEGSKEEILGKRFWHEVSYDDPMKVAQLAYLNDGIVEVTPREFDEKQLSMYGGYGYNYQYLGNSRVAEGYQLPFRRSDVGVRAPSQTIVLGDTEGANEGRAGQYVLDPPLPSERGSGRPTGYYAGSDDPDARSTPSARNMGRGAFVFADGHARQLRPDEVDDSNSDGELDNGYWNGTGEANIK